MKKDDVKEAAVATIKGAVGIIPIAGGLLSEYIGLVQQKIADKRTKEWVEKVEGKIEKLSCDIERLSNNELFYSALHIATSKVMKEHQQEKIEYFANAIYNTVEIEDISEEKKIIFLTLLEKYTLSSIKLLKLFSENNHRDSDYVKNRGSTIITTSPGQERLIKYITTYIKEFESEKELAKNLTTQLFNDGLLEEINFEMPEYPDRCRRKRTTSLGDEFLQFITD